MTKNILQELQGLFFFLFSFDGMDVIVRTRICRYGLVGILFFFFSSSSLEAGGGRGAKP